MTLENDFLLFATGVGANVETQATYAADPTTSAGRGSGDLPSNVYNKIARQGSYGAAALAQLINNAGLNAIDDGNLTEFVNNLTSAIQQIATGSVSSQPGGRLTLVTGTPFINSDQVSKGTVYYTANRNNSIPIYNGTNWQNFSFSSDLSLALTNATANSIVDVFGFNNSGNPTLGYGPAWSVNTLGSCSRGTGAGTTQLGLFNNLWTNANTINLTNGTSSYNNIAVNNATYLGSIWLDSTTGQTSCYVSYGASRKWGVWNYYNRSPIYMQAGTPSGLGWSYNGSLRYSNGSSTNSLTTFTGMAEEFIDSEFNQYWNMVIPNASVSGSMNNAIGLNGVNAVGKMGSGYAYYTGGNNSAGAGADAIARYIMPPALGLNALYCLETATYNTAFGSSQSHMLLSAMYRA